MDVAIPVLHLYVSKRVDQMVDSRLVEEGKVFFAPKIRDYDYGIRRATGVPEMDEFFRTCRHVESISRMRGEFGWQIHWLNATEVFLRRGGDANEAWEKFVLEPITNIVARFICKENIDPKPTVGTPSIAISVATTNN
ncbi:UNVERIFIED_CONTAM: Adenylate isopentenyltransferase 5, chloroplastic [Sesamum indicum]